MESIAKCLLFFALFTATYGRYIRQERNASESADCSCDIKYFKHYEIKGCVAETVDSCGCPTKFACTSTNQTAPAKVCVRQNKEYTVGSKVITSNPCEVCRCQNGVPPQISCISKECPPVTGAVGCHPVYKKNKCCPHEFECLDDEVLDGAENATSKTCEYNGKLYPFGSRIYPEDDVCRLCVCDENWTSGGVNSTSCYEQDCLIEKHRSKLEAGCVPVYHERRCCPIEFYCPSSHNTSSSELPNNESSEDLNTTDDNDCYFAEQFYGLGEELAIGNPCVRCTCAVPPDFTCVHQTCPPSPSEDFCNRIYIPGECCPTYECMVADGPELIDGCPTPMCEDSSCRIEVPEGHECPTCVCDNSVSELEHNNLEQVRQIIQNMDQMEGPVQQISQNMDQMDGPVQQVFQPYVEDDFYEEGLQMMPLSIQDSEEQFPEDMMLLESEELEEHLNGDMNSTVEEEAMENPETLSAETNKVVQKRSEVPVSQKEKAPNDDIEREGVDFEDDHFDDELKKIFFDKNGTIINEIFTIDHTVKVPPGCPTPLCEGPWCKIGIPEGHQCPTCICKRGSGGEP